MTLNITLINHKYCVIATDRRITASGITKDDEYDKSCVLFTDDARMGITFSGLAEVGGFNTHQWLLKSLPELGAPDYRLGGILNRLCEALSNEFKTNQNIATLNGSERRLSIMMAGFIYGSSMATPFGCVLSNWQYINGNSASATADDKFHLSLFRAPLVGQTKAYPLGISDPVDGQAMQKVVNAAYRLRASTISRWLAKVIKKAADSPEAKGLVGKQIVTLQIPLARDEDVTSDYFTARLKRNIIVTASVWAKSSGTLVVKSIEIGPATPDGPPMAIPQVNKNQMCPCGSGKRYKHCHKARH